MKIFIWNDPYSVAYGGSFLFVAAETEEQARELARIAPITKFGFDPAGGGFHLPLGNPTRVIDAPGGECYEWFE